MTKKALAKVTYTNISKKAKKEAVKSQRGETFVGYRPTFFKDKTKYDRKKMKNFSDCY